MIHVNYKCASRRRKETSGFLCEIATHDLLPNITENNDTSLPSRTERKDGPFRDIRRNDVIRGLARTARQKMHLPTFPDDRERTISGYFRLVRPLNR